MHRSIGLVTLVVSDYDEAIEFYTEQVGFQLVEDTPLPQENKRWVVLAPANSSGCQVLLAKAANRRQTDRIGDQTGGRVSLFLHTDDFHRDYNEMTARGVTFVRNPRVESYGTVAVFRDLYGNLWDLIQPKTARSLPSSGNGAE